jgi:hypothetical protein
MRIILILLPVFAFSQIFLVNGVGEEGPFLNLMTVFKSDYENLKAFATFNIELRIFGGNLFIETSDSNGVEYFQIDLENIQLSYGKLRPSFPFPDSLDKNDWLLRIGGGYIVFSESSKIWSKIGPIIVGAGEHLGAIGGFLEHGNLGVGYLIENSFGIAFLKVGESFLGFSSDGLRLYAYGSKFVVSFDGKKLRSFFTGDNGYLSIENDEIEFMERMGSVYVVGWISKQQKRLGIGIEF